MENLQFYKSVSFMPWEVIVVERGEAKPVIACPRRYYSSLLFLF